MWNQLIDDTDAALVGAQGITITKTNHTITANGTAIGVAVFGYYNARINLTASHKYLFTGFGSMVGSSNTFEYMILERVSSAPLIKIFNDGVFTFNSTSVKNYDGQLVIRSGYEATNFRVTPQLYDLTQMFGTDEQIAAALGVSVSDLSTQAAVDAFESMFPADYYPYNEGELLSFEGESLDTSDTVLGEHSTDISAWKDLKDPSDPTKLFFPNGLCSAGTVHDEVFATTAIRRVGSVDLGNASWTQQTSHIFYTDINNILKTNSVPIILNTMKYTRKQSLYTTWDSENNYYGTRGNYTYLYFQDLNCSTVEQIKAAMNGVMLYYALATPVELPLPTRQDYSYPVSTSTVESIQPDNALLSLGWNQLLDTSGNSSNIGVLFNGITVDYDNITKLYRVHGNSTGYDKAIVTVNLVSGHTYIFKSSRNFTGAGTNKRLYIDHGSGSLQANNILQFSGTNGDKGVYCFISNGTEVDFYFNIQLIDLTQMFGTDAEIAAALGISVADITTNVGVAAFERLFPASYYPYNAGQQLYVYPSQQYYTIPASPSSGETKPFSAPAITTNDYGVAVSDYVPNGYTRLEYIEGTGTQYIDTNISAPNGFKVETEVQYTNIPTNTYLFLIGAINDAAPYERNMIGISRLDKWFIGAKDGDYQSGTPDMNKNYIVASTITKTFNLNGIPITLERTAHYTDPSYSSRNILIFTTYNNAKIQAKLYSLKMYNYQDKLALNLYPCTNPNGEVGMYDTVTHTFFGNSGTGVFVAGPVV